ncbi:ATPase [Micromonospora polyrhachis]|uniref:MinD-like ATPase involved in chromosome partitioning or flagellar assembly n=1 Tax=Micromonospora polyrhachis TaxID=1282883 RepID=A0A7W7WRP2_9ACTN|nr:MinD-like ATPase involved in chromosome partitioning or flagellar assembly [Micromonospora polyrhachis]
MDGTETGWGRPGEPAPRWRALLDRARLGRTGEHDDSGTRTTGDRWHDEEHLTGGPAVGNPGQPGGADVGNAGRFGGPADLGHPDDLGPPGFLAEPPRPGESRFALLENGYRAEPPRYVPPADSSYPTPADSGQATPPQRAYPAPVERGFPRPMDRPAGAPVERGRARPVPPRYAPAVDSGQSAPGIPAPGQVGPGPGVPAQLGPGPGVPAQLGPGPGVPAQLGPGPVAAGQATPGVSRYAALETGYHAEPGYPEHARTTAREPMVPRRLMEWRESRRDSEVDRAVSVLRRDLGSPRVLAFANPKGGVHKTTATVLAAATVGSVRGRGVLAWDDNELRGTLGLRAGSARHARTIRHLITDLIDVESRHGADLVTRLDDYLRHASDGSYDVLAGEESPRFAQQLDQHTVRRVLDLLRRTHEVICVDTGNNVESVNWQTVLRAADQLVLTTVPREDAAFTADWMLDLLHEVGMGELANNAVTLLSCPTPGRSPLLDDLERHFATRTRAVAVVPYDPALEVGSSIEYGQLQQGTREAWLRAASVMLEPFVR